MASELLTTLELKSITEKDEGRILSDGGGLRGRVRINRKGETYTSFEYKYRQGQKSRTIKVGNYPDKSLAEIRNIHRQFKSDLSNGVDPVDARNAEKLENRLKQAKTEEDHKQELERIAAERAARRTLKDAIKEWEKLELKRRKDKGAEVMRAIDKDIIPNLGDVALINITRSMVVDELFRVVERGANSMANHLLSTLKQFFNFALVREWIDSNPLTLVTKEKIGGKEALRERFLSEEEIIDLKQKLPNAGFIATTEIGLWILLSTACRVGELLQAEWKHVDFEIGTWSIPVENSKNKEFHTIYLSPFCFDQFKKLHAITGNSKWCYPGRKDNTHVTEKNITKQVRDRIRDTALKNRTKYAGSLVLSGGPWTPHDLRRTASTLMGELGIRSDVIDRCQNHVEENRMKRIYQRQELKAEQKEAWNILGERLSLLFNADDNRNVIVGKFEKSA